MNKSIKPSQLKTLFSLKTVKTSIFITPLQKFLKTSTFQIYSYRINNFENKEIFFKDTFSKTNSLFLK